MALGAALHLGRLSRGLSRRLAYLLPLIVLVGAVALRMADPPAVQRLRDYAFDSFQRLAPRPWGPDLLPVRIVDVDEASLRAVGQWPWPRTKLAELFENLTKAGAVVIAFDGVLAEPDRTSMAQAIAPLQADLDAATFEKLKFKAVDNDKFLAEAMKSLGNVVLGFARDPDGVMVAPVQHHGFSFVGDNPSLFVSRAKEGNIKNLQILEDAAAGIGCIMTDISGVIRYVPLFFHVAGSNELFPALSIEALRVLVNTSTYTVKSSNASDTKVFGATKSGIDSVKFARKGANELDDPEFTVIIPTTGDGSIWLYDSGHQKERFISAIDVLNNKVPPEKIEGHIILVGSSSAGLKDLRNTPIDSAIPGVEIHAQIIEQIFALWKKDMFAQMAQISPLYPEIAAHSFIFRPDYAEGVELVYLVVVGLLILFLLPRLPAVWMGAVGLLAVVAALVIPWLLFRYQGSLFDPIYPATTVAAMYVLGSAFSFIQTELDRAQIRNAFGMYLAPAMVERLARNPDQLVLGGETRDLTIMFTDVRGFTTISEQFDAQGLTRFMNRMLTPMTDIILACFGTIDKYMGDAIMAFWNAPLDEPHHAQRACNAALEMQSRLRALNAEWREEAEREGRRYIEVRIGIGLNTGPASVGNLGSTQRFTYTAISDDVNLASRLEGQCKTYVVSIIIGEKTHLAAKEFAAVELDLIKVKGKTAPERIYSLVGDSDLAGTENFKALLAIQGRFLEAYRAGKFADAAEVCIEAEDATDKVGWIQGYYRMMRNRCEDLIETPPENWDGVYVAKEK